MRIKKYDLDEKINSFSWTLDGDSFERLYGHIVSDTFPNSEHFWKLFVTPSTFRIHNGGNQIRQPKFVNEKIAVIGNHNYVMFQHIIKCYALINSVDYFAIDDFYSHLVSILDNFESLVEKLIGLLSEYDSQLGIDIMPKLTEVAFIKIFRSWYKKNYQNFYDSYMKRGRLNIQVQKVASGSIMEQFFGKRLLKRYVYFDQSVRQTRNLYVHGLRIGNIVISDNVSLQPRHSKISEYRDDYRKVFEAKHDPKKLRQDFIVSKVQMQKDLAELKEILNELYNPLLEKLRSTQCKKFFKDLYGIDLV